MGTTSVSIEGESFSINGRATYAGRTWQGVSIEGLLLNARLVQATFDDLNPGTRSRWRYPDGREFDAEANTDAFIAEMAGWRRHGLLGFTLNLQGGSPQGYSREQPWHNSAFGSDGLLREDYRARTERILGAADALGMVVILGLFYFGQDERLADEAAVVRAVDEATDWLVGRGDRNVLIEVNNECDNGVQSDGSIRPGSTGHYHHAILRPPRVAELIRRVQERSAGKLATPAGRLLVSTSSSGGRVPDRAVLEACDYVLIHGNGVSEPGRMAAFCDHVRHAPGYRGQPLVNNEDDHYDFGQPDNNFLTCLRHRCGWGFFDYRRQGEPFEAGYQSVPTDWTTRHERKRAFFDLLAEVTGGDPPRS